MSYLLYCILQQSPAGPEPENVLGVEGEPVALITRNDLAVAVSKISGLDLAPDLGKLLAYGKVIEKFHHKHAVIPLRFGCCLETKSQIAGLLEKNSLPYQRLLQELYGCTEMGIRFLLPGESPGRISELKTSPLNCNREKETRAFIPATAPPGLAYLAGRKTYYTEKDRALKQTEELINHFRQALAGLYLQSKTEAGELFPPPITFRAPLLSLFFLVSKNYVEPFRRAFRKICQTESGKMLLTGPWPPYNFALLDETTISPISPARPIQNPVVDGLA